MQNFVIGLIFFALVLILYLIFFKKDPIKIKKAAKKGSKNLIQNSIRIFSVFLILGILQSFLSKESVGNFLLNFSNIKGIFSGIITGALMMGPPATGYPIGQYLLENNATISLVSAFLLSWVMLGIISLSLEFKYLGKKFTLLRNFFALIAIFFIALVMEGLL
ncbi:hypothetical protein OSSY52_13480 [Tepiditoga spiralis]|uniref:Permease n=1 Tax=Tepiditoga spiralis TaxID=2108365 RepID=A0A7G1G8D1_9BACT|nr:hypothetical protein [Tepiditoga spiralis]BBE31207.1 hypothetical protein OSSY52_13480 [Tepiditoga spiralis]